MSEREQLNLKIKSEKLEDWREEARNNTEYSSMTDLVRQSVQREIEGTHDDGQPIDGDSSREIAETKDQIRSLQNQVDTLSSVMKDLKNTVKSNPSDKHLRSEVFAAIPPEEGFGRAKSAKEIANELGEPIDEQVVFQALEDLADEVSAVERIYVDGATEAIETKYQKKE
jgi:hypothetical protein